MNFPEIPNTKTQWRWVYFSLLVILPKCSQLNKSSPFKLNPELWLEKKKKPQINTLPGVLSSTEIKVTTVFDQWGALQTTSFSGSKWELVSCSVMAAAINCLAHTIQKYSKRWQYRIKISGRRHTVSSHSSNQLKRQQKRRRHASSCSFYIYFKATSFVKYKYKLWDILITKLKQKWTHQKITLLQ